MKRQLLILLIAATASAPLWAANDSREKQMLRRMQQQIQQVEQARAQAEQEKAAALADKENLERELSKLMLVKKQLTAERSVRKRIELELAALQSEQHALKTRVAEVEAKLADSHAQQRATVDTLARTETAKKQTEAQLAGTRQDLKQCQTHNGRLYGMGREMMQKYRDKSCQDALAQAEPFTGLKKVEMENLLETWRDQLDRERLSTTGKP